MLRDLTSKANRRQGIVALVALTGLALPATSEAKKKGRKLGDTC